jgi:hypothetical protein
MMGTVQNAFELIQNGCDAELAEQLTAFQARRRSVISHGDRPASGVSRFGEFADCGQDG